MSMVKYNPNDPGIKVIEDIFTKLAKVNDDFYQDLLDEDERELELEEIKKLLEKAFYDRFGISIGLVYAGTFAIMPIYNTEGVFNLTKDITKTNTISKTVYKNFIKNMKKFSEFSKKHMLVLDIENARVENLPKDIKLTMFIDFDTVATVDLPPNVKREVMGPLSPQEVTAVVLHEIGHAFTFLEMYSLVHHTTIRLVDDLITNNRKDIKKLGIVFDKDQSEFVKNKDNKEFIFKTVEQVNEKMKSITLSKTGAANNDTEYEADAFVVRLGYGKYLVSALSKIINLDDMTHSRFLLFSFINFLIANSALILVLTIFAKSSFILSVAVIMILTLFIIMINTIRFIASSVKTRIPNDDTHGDPFIRYENIKFQMIQLLRKENLSPSERKNIIKSIQYASEMLDKLDKSIYSSIWGVINYDETLRILSFNVNTEETLSRILDKLINNLMYYQRDRFKYTLSQEEILETYLIGSNYTIAEERLIDPQLNDPVVKELIDYFTKAQQDADLINLLKKPDIKKINKLMKVQEPLRKIIFKRFGIDVLPIPSVWLRILMIGDPGFASIPLSPGQQGSLKNSNFMDATLVLRLFSTNKNKFNNSINNLLNNKVSVDFKNAKIKGLEGIEFPLLIQYGTDYLQLSNKRSKFALDPEEATAILLHEVGHLFTYISGLGEVVSNNKILLDNILTYNKKIEEISKTNVELTEEQKKDIEKMLTNTRAILTHITNSIKDTMVNMVKLTVPYPLTKSGMIDKTIISFKTDIDKRLGSLNFHMTDSEEVADDFAIKFGMGGKLASGLNRMFTGNLGFKFSFMFVYLDIVSLFSIIEHTIFFGLKNVNLLVNKLVYSILYSIRFDIFTFLLDIMFGEYFAYDKLIDRVDIIKTQTIKMLRDANVPNDMKKIIIKELDEIIEAKKNLETSGIGNLFIRFMFTSNRNAGKPLNPTILEKKLLNELMNNEIYIARERFRLHNS